MSYRPKYKKSNGEFADLPIDAETINGKIVGNLAYKDKISETDTDNSIQKKLVPRIYQINSFDEYDVGDTFSVTDNDIFPEAQTLKEGDLAYDKFGKIWISFSDYDGTDINIFKCIYKSKNYYVKPENGIPKTDLDSDVQSSLQKANNALPLSGGTLTGNLTGKYITGTWLQSTESNHLTSAASKIAVQDGSGWIYHRTASEIRSDIGAATKTNVNSVSMVPYGGQATTLSSLASGGVYSISANGYLRVAYQTTAADNFINMKQVSSSGADMWGALSNGQKSYGSGYPIIYMPVAKGDHIKVDFSSSVKIIQVQLIKVKTV